MFFKLVIQYLSSKYVLLRANLDGVNMQTDGNIN